MIVSKSITPAVESRRHPEGVSREGRMTREEAALFLQDGFQQRRAAACKPVPRLEPHPPSFPFEA